MTYASADEMRRDEFRLSWPSAFFTATTMYDLCVAGGSPRHLSPISVLYETELDRAVRAVFPFRSKLRRHSLRFAQMEIRPSRRFLP